MKALVYTNPNEMQLLDRPYPSLDQDERQDAQEQ